RGKAGGTVERERPPLVAVGRAHEGLARTTGRRGRGLRGRLCGSGPRDRRTAGGVERCAVEDEASRSAGVRAGAPVPPGGLAANPVGLGVRPSSYDDLDSLLSGPRAAPASSSRETRRHGSRRGRRPARPANRKATANAPTLSAAPA